MKLPVRVWHDWMVCWVVSDHDHDHDHDHTVCPSQFYDGDELRRYLNQTEGVVMAAGGPASEGHPWVRDAGTTADTALGSLLSAGNHHAAGVHGATPSGTSRYYSVDFGLIHFVALDLNMYNGVDTCGEPCRRSQLEWLEKDLAAADRNRHSVPWIVAMSHFPLYCSNCPAPGHEPPPSMTAAEAAEARAARRASADFEPPGPWFNSEACEFVGHDKTCTASQNRAPSEATSTSTSTSTVEGAAASEAERLAADPSAAGNDDMVPDFEPVFMRHGVDVYASGHIHDFEFIYAVFNNSVVGEKSFRDPQAPVHLVTGNGGPPSASRFGKIADWSHLHSSAYSYTRMVAYNASTMKWQQVANDKNSTVLAEVYVTQDHHGPFPVPPALP